MDARDVDLRFINRCDPREELAAMGLFPPQNEMKDVDLRYNNRYDPREELTAMGLLPTDNEMKGLNRQQENESQIQNPAAELAAMGLLPQQNFGGRPDETECVTHRERRDVSARPSYGASREQSFPNRASIKRSSSPSSSTRKRTPPKEMTDTVTRMNPDCRAPARNPDGRAPAQNVTFSADDACNMLMVICDKLGIIGVSFKSVLKRALEFEPDTHKMLKVFQESDTLSLMEVVSQKINDSAQNPKNNYDMEIMKKASIYIRTLIEKSKQECFEIVHGIDVSRLAHVTFGKETKYIIQMIRTELEFNGVGCPQSILSEIFQKVSMRHFSIMKSNENHNKSLSTCNSLDIKTGVGNPKLPLHSSDNRAGVSELLRSESRKSEPLGLTESLMQVNTDKVHSDNRGNNQFDTKGLAQYQPHKGNSRERDSVDRKFRDIDGRLHTDRGYIRERDSADQKFRHIREVDRRQDLPYKKERDVLERRCDFDERKTVNTNFDKEGVAQILPYRGNSREPDSVNRNFRNMQGVDERKDILPENLHNRTERDGQGRRDGFEEGYGRNKESRDVGLNQNQLHRHERENYKRNGPVRYDNFRDGRGNLSKRGASRENQPHKDLEDINRDLKMRNKTPKFWEGAQELIIKEERITRKDDTPKEASPKMPTLHNRTERDSQGRRDGFEEGYGRNKESRDVGINQNQLHRHERENYKRNGPVRADNFRDRRGHLSKRGVSRVNQPHRDLEDLNREIKIRRKTPKFWEGAQVPIIKKERIPRKDETPEEASPKMPTIQEMMEDLEQMQAMAEKENEMNEAQMLEGEINEDTQWLPEGELDEERCQEELSYDDTEDQRDNGEGNIETELNFNDNGDIDDNLKETFGNKGIAEVPWQELVKKLAPEGMIKPTDIDDEDENFENRDIAQDMIEPTDVDYIEHNDNDCLDDYGSSLDNNYGSVNYNHSQYNCNAGSGDHYMNSYDDNLNEDNYYDNQNSGNHNVNDENSSIDLMIPDKFIKDRTSNNENLVRNNANYLQENRPQYPEYQRNEYGSMHQYNDTHNYVDQRIGGGNEQNTNEGYDYSYGKSYGEESTQSTTNSYRAKSDSYNSYDYSSEAQKSYEYDPGGSTSYSGGPPHESQSYSQAMGANSYNYIDQNSHPYPSGYKEDSYQSGYKDESADQQYSEPYKNPYNDSGYEAESSEYSVEMPVEFIKPKKTLDNSLQNPPPHNSNTWLADQIKALATSNLGKEELTAKMAQILNSQKLSVR